MANIKFVKKHLVMDEFSYINCKEQTESIYFPRTMKMTIRDVENYLSVTSNLT